MPAVAYHFTGKTISRARGQSAVASAAYRTGEKLKDERLDKTFDYTRKQGVEFVLHAAPKDAPAWAHDKGQGWNEAERVENRKNSTLAREYEATFPHQLNQQQREYILKDFIREQFTRKGFMATAALHSPGADGDERNFHAHIMFSDRPIHADGFDSHKDRSFTSYKEREETLLAMKVKWAELGARQLQRAGFEVEAERWRLGYMTLPEQKAAALSRGDLPYAEECDREATKHLGPGATGIEREGKASDRGDLNREIESRNTERREIRDAIKATEREAAAIEREPLPPIAEAKEIQIPRFMDAADLARMIPDGVPLSDRQREGMENLFKVAQIVADIGPSFRLFDEPPKPLPPEPANPERDIAGEVLAGIELQRQAERDAGIDPTKERRETGIYTNAELADIVELVKARDSWKLAEGVDGLSRDQTRQARAAFEDWQARQAPGAPPRDFAGYVQYVQDIWHSRLEEYGGDMKALENIAVEIDPDILKRRPATVTERTAAALGDIAAGIAQGAEAGLNQGVKIAGIGFEAVSDFLTSLIEGKKPAYQLSRDEYRDAKAKRIAALDHIAADRKEGRGLSQADLAGLHREDLQQIRAKGDSAIQEMIEQHRRDREREQRERDYGTERER